MQVVVEDIVVDAQCGFISVGGCTDVVYCACRLVKKAIKHNAKVFLLFVDLQKAYNSVPRFAMWLVL